MSKKDKAITKLRENSRNVRYEDIDSILCNLGCTKRMKGSHATYTYPGLRPITIPYRKPFILPVYVEQILELLDQITEDEYL
jgi:predicted RNA binding protein YcfA (HicA-like mRNA interferase family)